MQFISVLILNVRTACEFRLAALQQKAEQEIADMEKAIDGILAEHGARRCKRCNGTGALERLDGSYMRRFGLQDWTGCGVCGGEGERRGRGFIMGDPRTAVQPTRLDKV